MALGIGLTGDMAATGSPSPDVSRSRDASPERNTRGHGDTNPGIPGNMAPLHPTRAHSNSDTGSRDSVAAFNSGPQLWNVVVFAAKT